MGQYGTSLSVLIREDVSGTVGTVFIGEVSFRRGFTSITLSHPSPIPPPILDWAAGAVHPQTVGCRSEPGSRVLPTHPSPHHVYHQFHLAGSHDGAGVWWICASGREMGVAECVSRKQVRKCHITCVLSTAYLVM